MSSAKVSAILCKGRWVNNFSWPTQKTAWTAGSTGTFAGNPISVHKRTVMQKDFRGSVTDG